MSTAPLSRVLPCLLALALGCSSNPTGRAALADAHPADAAVVVAAEGGVLPPPPSADAFVAVDSAAIVAALPDLAPDANLRPLPVVQGFTLQQCETYQQTICGTWGWIEDGTRFEADWANNARARIELVENGPQIRLLRIDTAGPSVGLTAEYTGMVTAPRKVAGTVTWTDKGQSWSGTWTATW